MLRILSDLSNKLSVLSAFRQNPDAVIAQYPELSVQEKQLIKAGNSAAVEAYLNGLLPVADNPPTIIVQAIVVIIGTDDMDKPNIEHRMLDASRSYWLDRVDTIKRKAA